MLSQSLYPPEVEYRVMNISEVVDRNDRILFMIGKLVESEQQFIPNLENSNYPATVEDALKIVDVRAMADNLIGAFYDNVMVGMVEYQDQQKVLCNLYVCDEYRGKGIGKELTKQCIEHFDVARIEVMEANVPLVKFYESLGFIKKPVIEMTLKV